MSSSNGFIKPRKAVEAMAPYSPPTGNRMDKLRLDFNENTLGCSPRVTEALKNSLSPAGLTVYPSYGAVQKTLAKHFQVAEEEFVLTNGTDEAIQVFLNTYVDDGQEVVILRPSYAMYRFYAEVAGASIREIDYQPPQFRFPLEELLAAITPQTRAVIVSNPNNPTGVGVDGHGIHRMLQHAPHAAVLIDEAYYEFSGVTALPWLQEHPNLFVSRTFSKVYGMAAMRIGCLFSHRENVAFLHKAHSPYSVNMLAAIAAQEAVQDYAYVERYVTEALAAREMLAAGLERLGIRYIPSEANFILALVGPRAIEVRDALRNQAILVRDRSYEIEGGVRITVGNREQTRRLLEELEKIWAPLSRS